MNTEFWFIFFQGLVVFTGGFIAILFFWMGITILRMTPETFSNLKEACKSDAGWRSFWSNFEAERGWRKRWKY